MEKETVRFWIYWHRGFVKLSLKKGQTISIYHGEPTDEGYSFEEETYHRSERGGLRVDRTSGGRDCDGQHEYYSSHLADENSIGPWLNYKGEEQEGITQPNWLNEKSSQYDQYAELMGY